MSASTAIRQLFLEARGSYSIHDAAKLLGTSADAVESWIDVGELEASGGAIPWSEVASFALDFWSQELVEEALGADLANAIPELLRLSDLEVRLPRMQVITLERLAALDGETVSAVLARELRDLVSVHSEWLSLEVTGFAEAMAWPERSEAIQ
jgi:hypothetical protein